LTKNPDDEVTELVKLRKIKKHEDFSSEIILGKGPFFVSHDLTNFCDVVKKTYEFVKGEESGMKHTALSAAHMVNISLRDVVHEKNRNAII
jgi:hypothetical protein